MDESLLDLTKIGVKLNCRPRWRAEFFFDMKQNCFCKIFLDPDPVKCSSKVKRLIFPTVLLLKVRMLQLCSSYVRERKTKQIPAGFLRSRSPTSQSNAKCKTVFLVDLRFSFTEIHVSKALFLFDKITLYIWTPILDLDSI